ncbi:CocE/NonD family hydrolase [Streptomyces sp. NPDC020883]|uniref:CocE/NonD family hydrolase n=1 Tax=Streptomyces sp. NPDC020883 TaxID=3365099 RepID=UPI0037A9DBC8
MVAEWVAPDGRPARAARWMRAMARNVPTGPYRVGCETGLPVPGGDGVPLVTDHYFPRGDGAPPAGGESPQRPGEFPTVLVRSPYGRGVPWASLYGIPLAEHGFHVVVQSCRGTGGSGGAFHLWRNEAADGRATVAWLRRQPWFNGALGAIGASYLGYTQWALALEPPPELRAMVVQLGLHDPHAYFHTGGAVHLENALVSGVGMAYQHQGWWPFLRAALRLRRWLPGAHREPAPYTSGPAAELPWLAEALERTDGTDPYWRGASAEAAAEHPAVPTCLIAGWQDVFLDQNLAQYRRLHRAGRETALLVGPWTHHSALQQGAPEVFAESLAWLRAHLYGERAGLRPTPVRIHVGGAGGAGGAGGDGRGGRDGQDGVGGAGDGWRDLAEWPPTAAPGEPWYLHPGGRLERRRTDGSGPVGEFRHDPAEPTPSLGGPVLSGAAGRRDNRTLEARPDVLTFTGPVLTEPLEVLGPVAARMRVTAAGPGGAPAGRPFDVFARLCDVDGRGRSVNVCDGLVRVAGPGGAAEPPEVMVPMSATAHRFAAGHRVRLQVSGGAFPRYAPPTGAPDDDGAPAGPVRIALHPGSTLELPT